MVGSKKAHGTKSRCDIVGSHGAMKTIMTLQDPLEPRGHCDTAGPCVTKGSLQHSRASWNQGDRSDTVEIHETTGYSDSVEPRISLLHTVTSKGHCGTAGCPGTNETIVTLQGLMEPRGHCDTAGLHGTKNSSNRERPNEIKAPFCTSGIHGTKVPL